MTPMFFTIGNNRTVKVIPNIQARVNGHPILTYTYNIYRSNSFDDIEEQRQESELLLEKKTDPNYLGYITFEEPGKIFTYIADGFGELTINEVEEIIEFISHYRDHPGMWDLEGA
jgi:hypothetical protein